MKRVLIAVLTSGGDPYPRLMETSLATWANYAVLDASAVFYSERQGRTHERLLQFDVQGGLYDMGQKNLQAYATLLANPNWDYLARVNASSYVCVKNLLAWVQGLPDTGVAQGALAPSNDIPGYHYLWGGCQFILSRDVVQAIVDQANSWDHTLMEDVAMSKLLVELGIPLDGNGSSCSVNRTDRTQQADRKAWTCIGYYKGTHANFEFETFEQFAKIQQFNFIRVKQDYDRSEDIRIMQELYRCGV